MSNSEQRGIRDWPWNRELGMETVNRSSKRERSGLLPMISMGRTGGSIQSLQKTILKHASQPTQTSFQEIAKWPVWRSG